MAKHITIKAPDKRNLTTFDLKGQRMDINIGGLSVFFLIHGRGSAPSLLTSRAATV